MYLFFFTPKPDEDIKVYFHSNFLMSLCTNGIPFDRDKYYWLMKKIFT